MSQTNSSDILAKGDFSASNEPKPWPKRKYLEVGFLNQAFFIWVNTFIGINQNHTLQQQMHFELRSSDKSRTHFHILDEAWKRLKNKTIRFRLLKTIIVGYSRPLAWVTFLGLLKVCLFFSKPAMINLMMRFVESPEPSVIQILSLVIILPLARLATSVVIFNSDFVLNVLGLQLKSALVAMIYSKSLKISILRNKDHSVGSIVNYYEVDCDKLELLMNIIQDSIVLPMQITIGIGVIYWTIGFAFLGGITVILCVITAGYFISRKLGKYREESMENKDERMKLLNEILNSIKFIKMNGWEKKFIEKVNKVRTTELKILDKTYFFEALSAVNFLIGAEGVLMATLGIYVLFVDELDVKKIMTMASTFWILTEPFQKLTAVVSSAMECKVAMERIEKFLLSEEIDDSYIKHQNDPNCKIAIKISNGNFSWKSYDAVVQETKFTNKSGYELVDSCNETTDTKLSEPSSNLIGQQHLNRDFALKDINLNVKKGEFIAIIGDVGAGKSSLLYSLLGEMYFEESNLPEVSINGNMVLLPQKPWIINTSLKENILFGKPHDEELYRKCLYYAALESDLETLPNRDDTEIGEKGINLSGGQKARVSLARALYSGADTFLLDDVLSAVDIHVGTFIIEECLTKHLADKTRVMATHNVDCLKFVNRIYLMEAGRIVNIGTLETLKDDPKFFELLTKNSHPAECKSEDNSFYCLSDRKEFDEIEILKRAQQEDLQPKKAIKIAEANSIIENNTMPLSQISAENIIEQITVAEDREVGNIKFSTIKLFLKSWGETSFLISWFSLSFLKEIILIICAIFISTWGNNIITPSENFRNVMIYYALDFIAIILQYIQFRSAFKRLVEFSGKLHGKMLTSIVKAPLNSFFDRVPSGRILNRFSDDIEKIDSGFAGSLIGLTISSFVIVTTIIFSVAYSNMLVIIPALISIVYCWSFYRQYTGLNRELQKLKSIASSPIASFFAETLQGVTIVRNLSKQDGFLENLLKKQDERLKNNLLSEAVTSWYGIRCAIASLIIIVPVCVLVAFFKDLLNLKVGSAGYLADQIISLCENVARFLEELGMAETRLIALERCDHFTKIRSEKINPSNYVKSTTNWPLIGNIKFTNYSTQYRPGLPCVINNFNLNIHSGEKIGIVGRTGSGKSTLMLSLLRLLESTEGCIEIDGVNIANVSIPELRRKITVIPQDPHLFEGSLRENLDVLSKYEDKAINDALDMLNLGHLSKSKEGLNFRIRSDGENLSAGEKQMVCIARALLKQSKIILIDEATSSIDINNEEVFLRTIKEKFNDSTVLMIAHRLKTIINCDKIVVMREGKVAELGPPEELIRKKGGIFSEMWRKTLNTKENF